MYMDQMEKVHRVAYGRISRAKLEIREGCLYCTISGVYSLSTHAMNGLQTCFRFGALLLDDSRISQQHNLYSHSAHRKS